MGVEGAFERLKEVAVILPLVRGTVFVLVKNVNESQRQHVQYRVGLGLFETSHVLS